MKKYIMEEKTDAKSNKFVGKEENYISDYPFEKFYQIYDYYKKFGLYKEEECIYNNSNGSIAWKRTIQKSNKIISDGNLIYLPLITKKQNFKLNFISECMAFVINNTIKSFPYFIDLKPIEYNSGRFDFISNRRYVIEKLKKEKNNLFKDNQVKLVNDLIEFFKALDKIPKGGAIHFKINYFNLIWEKMIQKYLNDYFDHVDELNNKIVFDYKKKRSEKRFEYQKEFEIDESENKFKINLDHYYEDIENKAIYVFDSKYYNKIDSLNYKQLTYTLLIGNSKNGNGKRLYSALILPGIERNKMHIIVASDYKQLNEGCNKIIEQYLDVNQVMLNYLNKNLNEIREDYNNNIEYLTNLEDISKLKIADNKEDYM